MHVILNLLMTLWQLFVLTLCCSSQTSVSLNVITSHEKHWMSTESTELNTKVSPKVMSNIA